MTTSRLVVVARWRIMDSWVVDGMTGRMDEESTEQQDRVVAGVAQPAS